MNCTIEKGGHQHLGISCSTQPQAARACRVGCHIRAGGGGAAVTKRCLQRENVHPTADGMGRVGVDDPAETFRIGYGLFP